MTESEPQEQVVRTFESLPFDPESTGKADPEKVWKLRETEQAHRFRERAFFFMTRGCVIVFLLWVVLVVASWPWAEMSAPMVFFLGAKLAIVSAVLLTLSIAIMRFAIQCAHHESKKDSDQPKPDNVWIKLAELFLKTSKTQTEN